MPSPLSSAVQPNPTANLGRSSMWAPSRVVLFLAAVRDAWRDAREMQRQAHSDYPYIGL